MALLHVILPVVLAIWVSTCYALPIRPEGSTVVIVRQGHAISEETIRQQLESEGVNITPFTKSHRLLAHLGIPGSIDEVLKRRRIHETQDLGLPFVFVKAAHRHEDKLIDEDPQSEEVIEPEPQPTTTTEPPSDPTTLLPLKTPPEKLLEEFMTYGRGNQTAREEEDSYKLGYSVDEGTVKRFRYEEKTPEGIIVGEFGIHRGEGDGNVRGVRYTAEAGVHPKVLYEALVKFLSL